MISPFSVVVFISGTGSNLLSILEKQSKYNYQVSLVVSDKATAPGLRYANQFQVPYYTFEWDKTDKKLERLQKVIKEANADLIALAGFMRILPEAFIEAFPQQIINIHPSLLPKYKGLHTHRRALENKDSIHGVTVHYVNQELDAGTAIAQHQIEVQKNDDEETLAQRLLTKEHKLFPYCIGLIRQNRVEWREGKLYMDGKELQKPKVFYD